MKFNTRDIGSVALKTGSVASKLRNADERQVCIASRAVIEAGTRGLEENKTGAVMFYHNMSINQVQFERVQDPGFTGIARS